VPPNPVPPGGLQLGDLAKLVMPQTEAPHNPPPPKEGRP